MRSAALLSALFLAGAQGQVNEYQLKAAFLFNFAKFVEWPAQTFKSASDPIVIGILGQNPFGTALEDTVNGKTVGGRGFSVRQVGDAESTCGCAILFISASQAKRFRHMADSMTGSGVLTVGETQGFAEDGGAINLKLERGSIRLEINVAAAESAQVHISSKLLSLANVVRK